jgi:polyhydroxyalkanoate synthesis regulator phasin
MGAGTEATSWAVVGMATIITLGVLSLLAHGFLVPTEPWDLEARAGLLARLKRSRDRILRSIKDVEFEHESGALAEEEFRTLRNDLKRRAIEATRELDRARKRRLKSLLRSGRVASPAEGARVEELVRARSDPTSLAVKPTAAERQGGHA